MGVLPILYIAAYLANQDEIALFEEGRYEAAANGLGLSVEVTSGAAVDTVTLLAMALIREGHPQRALEVLRRYPYENQQHCEQEVDALIDVGLERYAEAYDRARECLQIYPNSLILLEIRAYLLISAGRLELAERDIARMERLGASEVVLQGLRDMLGGLRQPHPTGP